MLISEPYRALNAELHVKDPDWGTGGDAWIMHALAASQATDILDYGAGKSKIKGARRYDPAIPEIAAEPEPADVVVCSKVLEHVEPECLDDVLDHLRRLTLRLVIIKVSIFKSGKLLSDGRNVHLIVEPANWWLERLLPRWNLVYAERMARGLRFMGTTAG
jgi:hypothetical protein